MRSPDACGRKTSGGEDRGLRTQDGRVFSRSSVFCLLFSVLFLSTVLCPLSSIRCLAAAQSWDLPQRYRVAVTVGAAGHARHDFPVEMTLTAAQLFGPASRPAPVLSESVRVQELDAAGGPSAAVPCQWDGGILELLLTGHTPADARRRFLVYYDTAGSFAAPADRPLVTLRDDVRHQEQESYRIETPAGVYLYHQRGAGFASLFDRDGHDWLSYRPTGGSAGNYRGIPNLVHPEGYFHPGGTKCTSRVIARGPVCVRIASEAEGGRWACTWAVYPSVARLTVTKAPKPFWFLYEGTPGGKLDLDADYYVLSDGRRFAAAERWDQDIPGPEWLYFGDQKLRRVLFLAHHGDDGHIDAYWPMQGNMTVFGFGRNGTNKYLAKTPVTFTVGLCEEAAHDRVKAVVEGAIRPVAVTVGQFETKGRTP
jgi:hypothetical protein